MSEITFTEAESEPIVAAPRAYSQVIVFDESEAEIIQDRSTGYARVLLDSSEALDSRPPIYCEPSTDTATQDLPQPDAEVLGRPVTDSTPQVGSGPPEDEADFVRNYLPDAMHSEKTTNVPWLVTLGQAALESGWGRHTPGNNFFGIKAKASDPASTRQKLKTKEVLKSPNAVFPEVIEKTQLPDGRWQYVVRDWFRVYPSPTAAFTAHGQFLRDNSRYAAAFTRTAAPYAFARAVATAGYATDPHYAAKLDATMRKIERALGGVPTATPQ